jgi:hypothetical protein
VSSRSGVPEAERVCRSSDWNTPVSFGTSLRRAPSRSGGAANALRPSGRLWAAARLPDHAVRHLPSSVESLGKRQKRHAPNLSRIQLDNELLVHDRGNLIARRNARDLTLELILIDH